MSGLKGRVFNHPSRKERGGRTIVFVYGIHGSLERFYGVIHYLARFGRVVAPDLPGFGGMPSFYSVGSRPSPDAYGDYLAEFIRQELPDGQLTLVGLSYGFVVITRMLARHPDLQSRADMAVSVMGLADGRDLAMSPVLRCACEALLGIARTPVLGRVLQYIITRRWLLRLMYTDRNPKVRSLPQSLRPEIIRFESYLWNCNDMRTYGACMHELFHLRQPTGPLIKTPAHHISTPHDHWLNIDSAERHIRALYGNLTSHTSTVMKHGGLAYDSEDEAKEIIPAGMVAAFEAQA
ncbi:MAG TPA: alpha/beta hydrolase [Candidatus Saccharimonadia bacterium]